MIHEYHNTTEKHTCVVHCIPVWGQALPAEVVVDDLKLGHNTLMVPIVDYNVSKVAAVIIMGCRPIQQTNWSLQCIVMVCC